MIKKQISNLKKTTFPLPPNKSNQKTQKHKSKTEMRMRVSQLKEKCIQTLEALFISKDIQLLGKKIKFDKLSKTNAKLNK
jgi:hypothetical protein